MKRNIIELSLIIFAVFFSNAAKAYDFEVDGIYYNITSMSNLEVGVTYKELDNAGNIYYCANDSYSGDIVIPASVNYNNRTFTITTIEAWAFGVNGLEYNDYYDNHGCKITSISLPSTIKAIRESAFQNCLELKKLSFLRI